MTYDKDSIEFQPKPTTYNFADLENQVFGRLTVIGFAESLGGRTYWFCKCICGTIKKINSGKLRSNHTQSCGCLQKERTSNTSKTHGQTRSLTYRAWESMLRRCNNLKDKSYERYGARGIKVCERWVKFENFLADMGELPAHGYTIDRKDNSGNYEPRNCRWATKKEQANNTRGNRLITFNGKTQPLAMWCDELHFTYACLHSRLTRGWSVNRTLTTPSR